VLVSVAEFGWLSNHVLILGTRRKRGKKKFPICSFGSFRMHMCLLYWSLSDGNIRGVPGALTRGKGDN